MDKAAKAEADAALDSVSRPLTDSEYMTDFECEKGVSLCCFVFMDISLIFFFTLAVDALQIKYL